MKIKQLLDILNRIDAPDAEFFLRDARLNEKQVTTVSSVWNGEGECLQVVIE